MTAGQTCFYRVEASCGIPEYELNNTSDIDVETIEFDSGDGIS